MTLYKWSQAPGADATADSTINWAEGQSPSSVNDSARGMMAAIAKYRDDICGYFPTSGTSTAYTLTSQQAFTSLALMNGAMIGFTPHATSGATPTLNVDGLGAKVIRNATAVALPAGVLLAGSVYQATYNHSSGEWLLHNQPGVLPMSSVTTAAIADSAVTFAKIQNVAATSLIGNATGSTAVPTAISIGTDLAFSGTTLNPKVGPTSVPGFLSGLELSTVGGSATFGISVGGANDVARGDMMVLASAYSKTTSAWAVGTGNGALDTSTIANNTWYHVYLIKRPDTGVVDVLVSLSASSPTMPTNYTLKRRIGSMKTNGSAQWTKFTQTGDKFIWDTSVNDAATIGTSRASMTLTVPTGVVVNARARAAITPGTITAMLFTSLQESDQSPSTVPGLLQQVAGQNASADVERLTNTSGQIGARATSAGVNVRFWTYGWDDTRGK